METLVNLPCALEKRINKEGNSYICISIKLCEDYEKILFPDKAEMALIKQVFRNDKTTTKINISKPTSETN